MRKMEEDNCVYNTAIDECEGWRSSDCCGAPIKFIDICEQCGEHCGCMCDYCEKWADCEAFKELY